MVVALTPASVGSPGVSTHFQTKVNFGDLGPLDSCQLSTWPWAKSRASTWKTGCLSRLAQAYQTEAVASLLYLSPSPTPHPALHLHLPVSRPKCPHPARFKTIILKKLPKGNGGIS